MEKTAESWCQLPDNPEIFVSDHGQIQTWETRNKRWSPQFTPLPSASGYVYFVHRGKRHAVHQLVARTFIGKCPENMTVDHIAKYNGDFIKERSDNRASNLRYATRSDQNRNQNKHKRRCDARPILIWKRHSSSESAVRYESTDDAARKLGLDQANLNRVANGGRPTIKGFCARFEEAKEPDFLFPDEVFRLVRDHFEVSQYGRIRASRSQDFSYTPKITAGNTYAFVGSPKIAFHRLVAEAWPEIVGEKSNDSLTLDHIDRNRANNRADNLTWATQSAQLRNQTRKPAHKISSVRKIRIDFKQPGQEWVPADSTHDAARKVSRIVGFNVKDSTISRKVAAKPNGSTMIWGPIKGWAFRLHRQ